MVGNIRSRHEISLIGGINKHRRLNGSPCQHGDAFTNNTESTAAGSRILTDSKDQGEEFIARWHDPIQ